MKKLWIRYLLFSFAIFIIHLGFYATASIDNPIICKLYAQDDDEGFDDEGLDDEGMDDDVGDLDDDKALDDDKPADDDAGDDDAAADDDAADDADGGEAEVAPAPPPRLIVPFKPDKKDPFKVLIVKKVFKSARPLRGPTKRVFTQRQPVKPPPPPVPPVNLMVKGIVGNDAKRVALVNFENQVISIGKSYTDPKGKFKVVDIEKDKVIIYSFKEGFRKTFKIPEEKIRGKK
ncbi:hypothetical protein ACFL35_05295 [Candidatus Riflebacteria bacterium]